MNDPIREAFERVSVPNFNPILAYRKPNGEYESGTLEDHWQTFQEGWEEAVKVCMEQVKQEFGIK